MKTILDEDIMYRKIISGECKITFTRNISDLSYKNGLLKIFDRGILPFMIATRFNYTSVEQVYKSTEKFSIVNKNRSAKSLLNKFLYDKCKDKGNSAFNNFPFKDVLTDPEFSNYIDSRMNYYKRMEISGKLNWKDISYYENCEILKKYFNEYNSSSTPIKLINTMVNDIFEPNGFIKYHDPCCGRGLFLYAIKNKLIEYGYTEDYAMYCISGQDSSELLCFVAQSILDPEGKYKPVIKCIDALDDQENNMKFDVIIGNPPYNKGIVKKIHSCYTHAAMDKTREGHIGFYIHHLEKLKEDGVLSFVTPGKFLCGSNSYNTRKWLFENYNVEKITFLDCKDVFPNISIESIVVMKISNGRTNDIEVVSSSNNKMYINPFNMKDLIVPRFNDIETLNLYNKLSEKRNYFPKHVCRNVGEYAEKGKKFFNKNKSDLFDRKVLTGIIKEIPQYEYTSLKSKFTGKWRIAAKEVRATYFTKVAPGIETDHTFYTIECNSEQECDIILKYVKTKLFKLFYKDFFISMHISAWINYIPLPIINFNDEEELYEYYGFNEKEKNYIRNYN